MATAQMQAELQMEAELQISRIPDMLKQYCKSVDGPIGAGTMNRFIAQCFEGEVQPRVRNAAKHALAQRRQALQRREARGRELQRLVVVKNCSIEIEEEEGSQAAPAAPRRARSEPRKLRDVDGRSDFLESLVGWLMHERLAIDLTTIARYAPWLPSLYTVDKRSRCPQQFVLSAADVEAILRARFPGRFRSHPTDSKKWELVYEKPAFVRPLADEELLEAIRELHSAGEENTASVLGTAELLRREIRLCRECRLGDLAQQLKDLKDAGWLRHNSGGKLECAPRRAMA